MLSVLLAFSTACFWYIQDRPVSPLLRRNFIILVFCPHQVLVYITVVVYKKHVFSFHPLVGNKFKINNYSSSNEVAM